MTNEEDRLLTTADVMGILRFSRSKIERMRRGGEIQFIKSGRNVRFRSKDIENWEEKHLQANAHEQAQP